MHFFTTGHNYPVHYFCNSLLIIAVFHPGYFSCNSTGSFFLGPFISTVFGKLEVMVGNSLYENLLLTGIVSRLACYVQPLLRSFLLNTQMVFHPSVRSLYQVKYLPITGEIYHNYKEICLNISLPQGN